MDTKQIARSAVEAEFRRRKKKRRRGGDDSSDEEPEEKRSKPQRPAITPSQLRIKPKEATTTYRDRARERREGKLPSEAVLDEDLDKLMTARTNNEERIEETADQRSEDDGVKSKFESIEQAKLYISDHAQPNSILGKGIVRLWKSYWSEVPPVKGVKHSSTVYDMTLQTFPRAWIIPSEKSFPSAKMERSADILPDDLIRRIRRALGKKRQTSDLPKSREKIEFVPVSNEDGGDRNSFPVAKADDNDDDDDDIFGGVGEYAGDIPDGDAEEAE